MADRQISRRSALTGTAATIAAALAGCSSSTGSGGGSGGQTYDVGFGDSATTVNSAAFPSAEKLYIYCVQSGWMNWPSVMEAFQQEYGVELNDDDRSSGEALQDAR